MGAIKKISSVSQREPVAAQLVIGGGPSNAENGDEATA